MNYNIDISNLYAFIFIMLWVAGIVIAKGFISITFAIFIPPYAWYLIIEKLMIIYGLA